VGVGDTAEWTYHDGTSGVLGRTWKTEPIRLHATEEEVRDALQKLAPIGTVLVKKFDTSSVFDNNSTEILDLQYRVIFVDAMFLDANAAVTVSTSSAGVTVVPTITNKGTNVLSPFVETIVTVP
jgi:hypothetical protein